MCKKDIIGANSANNIKMVLTLLIKMVVVYMQLSIIKIWIFSI